MHLRDNESHAKMKRDERKWFVIDRRMRGINEKEVLAIHHKLSVSLIKRCMVLLTEDVEALADVVNLNK